MLDFLIILTEVEDIVAQNTSWIDSIANIFNSIGGIVGVSVPTVGLSVMAVLRTILPNNKIVANLQNRVIELKETLSNRETELKIVLANFKEYQDKVDEMLVAIAGSSPNARVRELGNNLKEAKEKSILIADASTKVGEAVVAVANTAKKLKKKAR